MAKLKNKKISEKLLQLVKPYLRAIENTRTEQRLSSILLVGSTAWNIEVTDDRELKKIFLNLLDECKKGSSITLTSCSGHDISSMQIPLTIRRVFDLGENIKRQYDT